MPLSTRSKRSERPRKGGGEATATNKRKKRSTNNNATSGKRTKRNNKDGGKTKGRSTAKGKGNAMAAVMSEKNTQASSLKTSGESARSETETVAKWYRETCKRGVPAIKDEFVSLRKHMPSVLRAEVFRANEDKNRYRDVLCLDATRVNLVGHSTNYIHASWVDGSAGEKAFICAQGPMENTSADFWTMIWQEEVALVLMLCDIVENGKVKCFGYWPVDSTARTFGEFTVSKTKEFNHTLVGSHKCKVTCMELTKEGCAPRTVKHVQWADWPDRGVPQDARTVARLRRMCIDLAEGKPVVVHCSAGIGRTGTLVVIDVCMGAMDKGNVIDVADTLKRVREQRLHSVQTEIQYVFIYKALVDYAIAKHKMEKKTADQFNQQVTLVK